jgi:hypothetical protein
MPKNISLPDWEQVLFDRLYPQANDESAMQQLQIQFTGIP